ncbi:sigma-E factor negative regulatory protein [Corallincola platygyrae]|uniref:Anti-sigma-E factor RseA n=1 Tax=Corallincola platygyrae TaxID=1193278 RepID=A0ABW4XK53_9GAMM
MAADNQQRLSAWMDNQADETISDEMIDALLEDEALQSTYSRYQLIGDAIRGEMPPVVDIDLTSRIADALEQEPTVLAPAQTESKPAAESGKVVSLLKQLGQYAIAATVAAVAVLGVQQYNQPGESEIPTPVLTTTPLTGVAAPVSLAAPTAEQVNDEAVAQQQRIMEQRKRINAYLQDHEQQRRLQPVEAEQPAVEESDTLEGTEER